MCASSVLQGAMERTGQNVSEAARLLGMTRPALAYRLKKLPDDPDLRGPHQVSHYRLLDRRQLRETLAKHGATNWRPDTMPDGVHQALWWNRCIPVSGLDKCLY